MALDTNLSGPAFLLAYALFAALLIFFARRYARGTSGSPFAAPPPLVEVERDPFEIAYLRGGGGCLLRFALFELVRRKSLRLVPHGTKGKTDALEATGFDEGSGPGTLLSAIVAFAATARTPAEIFASPLPKQAESDGSAAFEAGLVSAGLLASALDRARARTARVYGSLALVAVSVIRMLLSLAAGHHNLGFLAIETIFAILLLVVFTVRRRTTDRGKAYIERIRAALGPVPKPAAGSPFDPQPLFVAAVGFDVLAGTQYAPLVPFVRTTSSDGSCGSGGDSGGGGDGGGGCGGGCGG